MPLHSPENSEDDEYQLLQKDINFNVGFWMFRLADENKKEFHSELLEFDQFYYTTDGQTYCLPYDSENLKDLYTWLRQCLAKFCSKSTECEPEGDLIIYNSKEGSWDNHGPIP